MSCGRGRCGGSQPPTPPYARNLQLYEFSGFGDDSYSQDRTTSVRATDSTRRSRRFQGTSASFVTMLVYKDIITGDEMMTDAFPQKPVVDDDGTVIEGMFEVGMPSVATANGWQ